MVYYRKSSKFAKSDKSGVDCDVKELQSLLKGSSSWQFQWYTNPITERYYKPLTKSDHTLVFESRFESGNLDMAISIGNDSYKLVMQNDSNTKGNCQWFYFRVENTVQNLKANFEIINYVTRLLRVKTTLSSQKECVYQCILLRHTNCVTGNGKKVVITYAILQIAIRRYQ